jgi:hypothetical protein
LCHRLGIEYSTAKYLVLGDDVLIGDVQLGESYLSFIKELGVDVSLAKTHISPSLCEFAKR